MTGKDLLERRRKNSIEAPQEEPAQESVGLTGNDLLSRRRKDRETEKLGPRYWVDETHYYTENPFPTAEELYLEKYNGAATGSSDLSPSLTAYQGSWSNLMDIQKRSVAANAISDFKSSPDYARAMKAKEAREKYKRNHSHYNELAPDLAMQPSSTVGNTEKSALANSFDMNNGYRILQKLAHEIVDDNSKSEKDQNRELAHNYVGELEMNNPEAARYLENRDSVQDQAYSVLNSIAQSVDSFVYNMTNQNQNQGINYSLLEDSLGHKVSVSGAEAHHMPQNAFESVTGDIKTDTYDELINQYGMSEEDAKFWSKNYSTIYGILNNEDAENRRKEYLSQFTPEQINAVYNKAKADATYSNYLGKTKDEVLMQAIKDSGIDPDSDEYAQMYEYIRRDVNEEITAYKKYYIKDSMDDNALSMLGWNVIDVYTSPVQGLNAVVGSIIDKNRMIDKTQPVDTNSYYYWGTNLSNAIQEGSNEYIAELANGNENAAKAGQFAYGVGSSTAKSLWSMYLGGTIGEGVSSAIGLTGKSAATLSKALAQITTLPSFGASAYATTFKEQIDKGMGEKQAASYAVISGINEMLYEELSFDKAYDAYLKGLKGASAGGLKTLFKNALMQAGIEGSEEVFTDLSNKLADAFINHDFSDHNTRVRRYVEQGYSEEKAEALVRKEEISEITETFFAGAVSGFATGAAQTYRGYSVAKRTASNLKNNPTRLANFRDDIIENAPQDSKARQIMESTKVEDLSENQIVDAILSLQELGGSERTGEEILTDALIDAGETKEQAKVDAQTILAADEQVKNSLDVEEGLNTKLSNGEQLTQDDIQKLSDLRTQAEETNKKYEENPTLAEVHNKYSEGKLISPAEIAAREIATANREMQQEKEEKRRNSLDNRLGLGSYSYKANANGQRLGIESFAEVTPNGAKLNTSRGVIDINDMQFDNPTQEALFKGAMQLENAEAANNMLKDYKGQDVRSYVYASQLAYFMGENGQKLDKLFNDNSAEVSVALDHMQEADKNNAHLQAMWELGTQNQQKRTVETVNVEQAKEQKKLDVAENDELAAVKQAFSNAFGFNISTDYSETGYNAKWVSSLATVFTTTNSKSSNEYDAIVHEMGEFTRAMNPEAYDNLKRAIMDFVAENKGEKALDDYIKAKQEVYRDAGRREERFKNEANKTYSQAADEFVNDFLAGAFATENGMKQMVDHVATSENFSASEKVSIFQSISDWINHLIDTIKNFLAGKKHNSSARLAMELEEMGKDLTELRSIALEALDGAKVELRNQLMQDVQSESNEAAEEFMGEQLYSEEDIEEASQENFSLDHDDDFMKNAIKENAKKGNANIDVFVLDRAKAVRKITKNELERMKQYLPEDIMGNIVVKNSSYSRSVENSLICVRSLVSGYFSDMVSERVGHPLSIEQQIITNQILAGLTDDQTECTYCYVKNDRMTYRAMFNSYYDQYMNQMDKVKANREAYENDIDYGYEEFLDGRKATKQMHDRYVHFVKDALAGEQSLSLKDLTTGKKRATFANKNSMQAWLVRDAERYSKSAAWPKSTSRKVKVNGTSRSLEYIAYNGNILKWDKSVIDALNSEFGLRMYSDSDYVPAFLLENMQVITDASIRGLKMLSYTKDCGYARVFGGTGMGINISCFGFWDENTQSVLMDGMMGADWEEAKAVRSQYNNVGTVFVATNDKCLEWALDQEWIDVVIPFHLVRTGNDIAAAYGYKNYKAQQEDKKNANWDKEKNLKSIPPTVHANNKEAYLAALEANNLKPRFEQYIDHPNYMKLVNETRMSYKDMMPVQPVFDLEEVRKELARIPKEGAYGMLKGISDLETQDRLLESYAEEAVKKIEGKEAFSIDEDNFDAAVREMMELGESVTKSENRLAETLQQAMDFDSDMSVSMSNKVAKRLIDQYASNLKRKDLGKAIHKVFSYINKTGKITQDAIEYVRQGIASDIVDSIQDVDESQKAVYNDFVNKVKTYDIALDGTQMAEIRNRFDTYMNFKRYMSGKLSLNKNGIQLDEVWTEICDMSNGALNYGENPANQPIALAEYINSLAPKARILENTTYEDATLDVAMEVFRQYFEEVADKEAALKIRDEVNKHNKVVRDKYKERFSDALKKAEMAKDIELDRLAKEIDNLTAEEQEALNQFGASIETEVIAKMKAQYIDRYAKLKQQKNEEIAKIKLDYRNDKIEKRSRRAKTEALDKLKREINALESMLAHPKEGATKHVPKQLVNATIDLLNAINQDTGKNKAVKEKLAKLAAIYDQLRIQNNATTNDKTNYGFDYDERIAEDIKEIQQIFEGGKTYDDLYVPEVERILEIVTALKTQIKNANNLIIDGQIQDARAVAEGAMSEVVGSRHYVNKTVDAISNAFNAYSGLHLNPYREFRRLSGYVDGQMMKLYKDLEEGSLKEMQIQKDLGEIFNDVLEGKENQKEVKRFISNKPGDLVEIGIVDEYGKPVKVSRAMRMSIIMHSKNEGNMTHIIFGGMNVPDMAEYKRDKVNAYEKHGKIYRFLDYTKYIDAVNRQDRAAAMQMTEDARNTIKGLEDDLSEWERNFLDDAMELFHNKTGEYINETSETLKGYTVARVKNYFPIKTDTKFVATDFAGLVQNGTIEGMGMLKERIRSNKPIMLEDITDVIQRQITNTSRYAALAIPVRNVKMAMKQIFRSSIDNRGELTTLEDVIGKVWSKNDVDNIKNLITALETGRGTNDDRMKWVSKLRGNFSGAVLTLNPSVAIKQAASFPTAAAVVGYKALGRAMLDIGKGFIKQQGIAELEKINPLLWYRNQGYATQDLADAKASGYMKNLPLGLQKALGWTQFMDSGTVRTLEYASMYYVEDNFKNLHRGSQAYWKKVSEIFTKVVTETQPNYDTMHKANIIRDGNALEKLLIMFKTQPFQNFGILYDAIGELNANSIRYKENKSAENKTALKNSVRNLAKAITSQMISAVTFSAMTILADLLLHRWKKYRDDDDEISIVAILSQLGSGAFSAFTGMFIAASDIINAVESFVNNKSFDGIDISTFSMLTDFLNSMTNLKKNIEKYNNAETTSDKMKAGQNIAKYSLKVTEYAGQIFGLPVGNIERMLQSVGLYVDDAITSAKTGEPHVSSRTSFTDREISSQYEMMLEAFLEGNTAEYDKLYNELIESGKSDKDIESKIKSMIKAEYGKGKIEPEKAVEGLEGLGFEESEARHTLSQWETGQNNKYGAVKTYINNAVDNPNGDNRRAVVNEIENLVGMGITKENILKNLKTEYKERYSEEINKGAGTELNSILRQALVAAGYTDDEAKEKLKAWVD